MRLGARTRLGGANAAVAANPAAGRTADSDPLAGRAEPRPQTSERALWALAAMRRDCLR